MSRSDEGITEKGFEIFLILNLGERGS